MPAWMAGIQVCRMRPETSMSAWIPALHAGMTESRSRTKTDRGPPPFLFSKERTKNTKEFQGNYYILISCCALRDLRGEMSVPILMRRSRAGFYVVVSALFQDDAG